MTLLLVVRLEKDRESFSTQNQNSIFKSWCVRAERIKGPGWVVVIAPRFYQLWISTAMEDIEITVVNWKLYNPQDFQNRYPHWFRLNKNILQSATIFNLTYEERWAWIGLLCLCCERKSDTSRGSIEWFSYRLQVAPTVIESLFKKMIDNNALAVNWQLTGSKLAIDTQETPVLLPTTRQDITRHNKKKVSSELAKANPRTTPDNWLSFLDNETLESFTSLYSKDYCEREFAKISNWLRNNPKKRPTTRGLFKFVSSWLERGWDSYRKTLPSGKAAPSVNIDELLGGKDA